MSLIFNASTTRALLSAVAPFAPLPGGYLTFPVVDAEPAARGPLDPFAPPPPLHAAPEHDEIELHPLLQTINRTARAQGWSEVGGSVDDSAAPLSLGAAAMSTTTGFAPRPRAESAVRSRTRLFTARLVALSRGTPQTPAVAEEGSQLLDGVKAVRASFASRTRRAFNSVFGPALGVPSRGDYVRLRGRN